MKPSEPQTIQVIDSHTGGEPTRVVISGSPEPSGDTMSEKRINFARDLDWLRTAMIFEPRGHEAMVGALLCKPTVDTCVAGVIFFNNVGVLKGCLHGTMGVAATLVHTGAIGPGDHQLDTPTGVVTVSVTSANHFTVANVRSYRSRTGVEVQISGYEPIVGDVAWGGNWFFLAEAPPGLKIEAGNIKLLTQFASEIRQQLSVLGIRGDDGAEVDHIELFGPPADPNLADSKNFVLCPGNAYDRSPCGTGTSAKLACLHASGKLVEGEIWRQAGILDTVFEGVVSAAPDGGVFPTVSGSAFVTAETRMLIDPEAMFAFGIPSIPS